MSFLKSLAILIGFALIFCHTRAFAADGIFPIEENPDAIADKSRAEKIIKFYNDSLPRLNRGYFSQEPRLANLARRYGETWELPKRRPGGDRKSARRELTPPKGIFNDAEGKALTSALDDMDKALDATLDKFAKLEAYVADDSVRDDGKEGERLIKEILDSDAKFAKAREGWLAIVEKRADEAERYLTRGHPLERQLFLARKMRVAMEEICDWARSGERPTNRLRQLLSSSLAAAKDASAPPFPAQPSLERLFREFLKKFEAFHQIVDRGIREGMGSVQRREILKAASVCGETYNEFAKFANRSDAF